MYAGSMLSQFDNGGKARVTLSNHGKIITIGSEYLEYTPNGSISRDEFKALADVAPLYDSVKVKYKN